MGANTPLGWAFPTHTARKAHFFAGDVRCLCGNYALIVGEADNTNHNSVDNCKTCMKKREKLIERGVINEDGTLKER